MFTKYISWEQQTHHDICSKQNDAEVVFIPKTVNDGVHIACWSLEPHMDPFYVKWRLYVLAVEEHLQGKEVHGVSIHELQNTNVKWH